MEGEGIKPVFPKGMEWWCGGPGGKMKHHEHIGRSRDDGRILKAGSWGRKAKLHAQRAKAGLTREKHWHGSGRRAKEPINLRWSKKKSGWR